ncbi:hypothetical protein JNW90_28645 [Micromonospora sp. STR1s_5]|nr:hypothetical protein [Micromonospora sp. STR1s_5]
MNANQETVSPNRGPALLETWMETSAIKSFVIYDPSCRAPDAPDALDPPRKKRELIEVSPSDFSARAKMEGWAFWRGTAVGFCAGLPLTYVAVTGQQLLPLT